MRQLFPEPVGSVEPLDVYRDLPVVESRPAVRLNMISSVDGSTALDGRSGGLGGPADRKVFAALRSLADVVLVAAGTVRAENYGPGSLPIAVVSGSLFFQSDTLGGLAAYVTGRDGTTYYYAHLNDYVGGGRSVSAGELIGHVGNTGDAAGGASHLHFEIRPGGPNGAAIDPYPTLRAHC